MVTMQQLTILYPLQTLGEVLSFDYSDEWSNQWGSGSSQAESYAVEKLPDGTFKLAIKRTDNMVRTQI